MKHQNINSQGVYAGLEPAFLVMTARRPALGAKLKAAAALAGTAEKAGGARPGSASSIQHTMEA
jgi:hypothetical protein